MDEIVKVRQLVITLIEIPWIKFDERIREFELYDNEFHFYNNEKDIIVQHDGDRYFVEMFFPNTTSYQDIYEIGKKAHEKMIKHFRNKISHFEDLIVEMNRHQ